MDDTRIIDLYWLERSERAIAGDGRNTALTAGWSR